MLLFKLPIKPEINLTVLPHVTNIFPSEKTPKNNQTKKSSSNLSLWALTMRDVGLRKLQVRPTCRQALVELLSFSRSLCPLIVKLMPGNRSTCPCRLQGGEFYCCLHRFPPMGVQSHCVWYQSLGWPFVSAHVCAFPATPDLNLSFQPPVNNC